MRSVVLHCYRSSTVSNNNENNNQLDIDRFHLKLYKNAYRKQFINSVNSLMQRLIESNENKENDEWDHGHIGRDFTCVRLASTQEVHIR